MYTVNAKSGEMLHLGREGENLVRQIVFDVSDWVSVLGDGVVEMIAIRTGDAEFYPCEIERDGDIVIWTITNADTAKPGRAGKCVLSYHVGGRLAKSETFQTIVTASPGNATADPPEPYQGWVDQVLAAGAAAKVASTMSGAAAEQAKAVRSDVEAAAEAAAQAKRDAQEAAGAVADAVAAGVTTVQNQTALGVEMIQAETSAGLEAIQTEGTAQVERAEQVGTELVTVTQENANRAEEACVRAEAAAEQAAHYTPVRGIDYWTDEDKAEMVNDVIAALLQYGGTVTTTGANESGGTTYAIVAQTCTATENEAGGMTYEIGG